MARCGEEGNEWHRETVTVTAEDVEDGIQMVWKGPGLHSVKGFWFKRFKLLHGFIAESLQGSLDSGHAPDLIDSERKDCIDTKGLCQGNSGWQLQTNCILVIDLEATH